MQPSSVSPRSSVTNAAPGAASSGARSPRAGSRRRPVRSVCAIASTAIAGNDSSAFVTPRPRRTRTRRSRRPGRAGRRCRPTCAGRAARVGGRGGRPRAAARATGTRRTRRRVPIASIRPARIASTVRMSCAVARVVRLVVREVARHDDQRLGAAPHRVEHRGDLPRRSRRRRRAAAPRTRRTCVGGTAGAPRGCARRRGARRRSRRAGSAATIARASTSTGTSPSGVRRTSAARRGEAVERDAVRGAEQDHPREPSRARREPCVRGRGDRTGVHVAGVGHDERLRSRAVATAAAAASREQRVDRVARARGRARVEACRRPPARRTRAAGLVTRRRSEPGDGGRPRCRPARRSDRAARCRTTGSGRRR